MNLALNFSLPLSLSLSLPLSLSLSLSLCGFSASFTRILILHFYLLNEKRFHRYSSTLGDGNNSIESFEDIIRRDGYIDAY